MTPAHRCIDNVCDFLQTYAVLVLSIVGSCLSVFLFYRNKLKYPLKEAADQAEYQINKDCFSDGKVFYFICYLVHRYPIPTPFWS